jgi:hypothetical protein
MQHCTFTCMYLEVDILLQTTVIGNVARINVNARIHNHNWRQ